jgi:hypothetical protein
MSQPDDLYALNDLLTAWAAERGLLDDDDADDRLNEATHAAFDILRRRR